MPGSRIQRYLRQGRLSQLAVFEASVRLGGYTRAAEELHLAQPTVSAQIRKLTDALGVPLFEQVGKRMVPTEAGRRVQLACSEVLGVFVRLEDELGRLRSLDEGRLSLGASTTAGRVASRLVATFADRHPQLDVGLHIHNRDHLLQRMARGEDDLYLFANPPDEGVVSLRIARQPLYVVAAPAHPLARSRAIAMEALAGERIIVREKGSGMRRVVEALFASRGLALRPRLELPSGDAIEEAVRAGGGIAILPLATDARGIVALDVAGFPLEGHLHLSYPIGRAPGAAARAFLDFARAGAPS
jgi:DNA-binding transcriptional LysR family regulator